MEKKEAFLKIIGTNIKKIRRRKGMEVKEVASKLDITQQGYGAIENGKVDLNISRLFQITNLFEVEFSEILDTGNGDNMYFAFQNNRGGNHFQKIEKLLINDENLKSKIEFELQEIKVKINHLLSLISNKST